MSKFNDAFIWMSEYDPTSAILVRERFARAFVDKIDADDNADLTPVQFYAEWAHTKLYDAATFVHLGKPGTKDGVVADNQQRETAVEQVLKLYSIRVADGRNTTELTAQNLVQDAGVIAKFLANES